MARRREYEAADREAEAAWYAQDDLFASDLVSLLDVHGDIASEAVWQQLPRLIARRWQTFTKDQSPLSTMGMIQKCAQTVLQIRLAARKGGGEEEARRLGEFQALMAEVFGEAGDDGGGVDGGVGGA